MKQENIKLFFNLNEEFHKIIYKYVDKEIAFVKIRSFDNHYSRFHLLESFLTYAVFPVSLIFIFLCNSDQIGLVSDNW